MRYFTRSAKLSNILIALAAVFFLIAMFVLLGGQVGEQVFQYQNGNYVKGGVLFAIWALLSAMCLIVAIALKCVVKDAREELDAIQQRYDGK